MPISGPLRLTEDELARRKRSVDFTPADESRIALAQAILWAPSTQVRERLAAVEPAPLRYFQQLTAGAYGADSFRDRLEANSDWQLEAYASFLRGVVETLARRFDDREDLADTLASFVKLVFLDLGLALDARPAETLEDATRQWTRFVVHDLQNPLATVQASLQALTSGASLPAWERQVVERALRGCQDLTHMVRGLLDFGEDAGGAVPLCFREIDLGDLLQDAAAEHAGVFRGAGHVLSLGDVPSVRVRTDVELLRRILDNLLRNALQHTPPGTTVGVAVEERDDGVHVCVADDGPGIPPELHANLFQPLGAAALRRAGRTVNTGLGLASCRAVARALGLELRVASDGHSGTTFSLVFPSPRGEEI